MEFLLYLFEKMFTCFGISVFTKILSVYKPINIRFLTSKFDQFSYIHQPSEKQLQNWTLGEVLDTSCKKYKNREMFVFNHQKIRKTCVELKEDVDRLACGLLAIGLKPGNLVGIWSFNCYEWVVFQFAVAKCGMTLVHLSAINQVRETEYCLKKVALNALLVSDTIKMFDYYKILCAVVPSLPESKPGFLDANEFSTLKHVIMLSEKEYPGTWKYSQLFNIGSSKHRAELESIVVEPDSPLSIMFTSGTTGSPKATVSTHHGQINNAIIALHRIGIDENDRCCISVPLFHTFGLTLGSIASVAIGYCSVFPSAIFSPEMFLQTFSAEKCDVLSGTPTMYIDLLRLPDIDNYDLSNVKLIISGGSGISLETGYALRKKFNCPVINGYGATEMSCTAFISKLTDSPEVQITKGCLLDHLEAKIVNKNGAIVRRNVPGELVLRGYTILMEYWKDPQKTTEAFLKNRWYKSGDIAVMDDEGNVEILARLQEVISRGGENIYPKEIEHFFLTNPNIAEIQVFGVADERYGQEICAWIKLKPNKTANEQELREFCKGQIAHIKIPKYFVFVESFPKSSTGKYLKNVMHDQSLEKLGLLKCK